MKSWRSRIAAGLAVGFAAVTLPLAVAGPASAASAAGLHWHAAGGGYDTKQICVDDAREWRKQHPEWLDYKCVKDGSSWTLFVGTK